MNGGAIGKDYESRQLSKEVRDLTLVELKAILTGTKKTTTRFREAIILKLAGSVLPRLNEVSGVGGEPMQVQVVLYGTTDPLKSYLDAEKKKQAEIKQDSFVSDPI